MRTIVDDVQELHDGFNAINGAIADHEEALIDNDVRVAEIERIQEQIQTNGPSRPLMEEIQAISKHDDLLLSRGVAIESFTTFPSRTNRQVSLEVSEEVKAGLIGAAVAAGLFLIYKIGKMIWNFFRKKKNVSESIAESQEKIKKATEIIKLIDEASRDAKGEEKELLEKQFKEQEEVLAKQRELLNGKWTALLEQTLGKSNSDLSKRLVSYLNNFANIEQRAIEMNNLYVKAPFQASNLDGVALLRYAEEEISPFIKQHQNEIDEEVRDAKEFAEQVRSLSATESGETTESLAQAIEVVKNSETVWGNLDKAAAFEKKIFGDEKFIEKIKENKEKIDKVFEKEISGISPENLTFIREKFKDLNRIFTKTTQVELAVSGSLAIIGAQYDAYCKAVEQMFKNEMGFFSKVFSKIKGNSALEKAKVLYDEYKLHQPEPKN